MGELHPALEAAATAGSMPGAAKLGLEAATEVKGNTQVPRGRKEE